MSPWANHSTNVRCDNPMCRLCHHHMWTGSGSISRAAMCSCLLTYGEFIDAANGSSSSGSGVPTTKEEPGRDPVS